MNYLRVVVQCEVTLTKKDGYYYVAFTYTFRFWFDKYKETSGIPGGKGSKKVGCPTSSGGF